MLNIFELLLRPLRPISQHPDVAGNDWMGCKCLGKQSLTNIFSHWHFFQYQWQISTDCVIFNVSTKPMFSGWHLTNSHWLLLLQVRRLTYQIYSWCYIKQLFSKIFNSLELMVDQIKNKRSVYDLHKTPVLLRSIFYKAKDILWTQRGWFSVYFIKVYQKAKLSFIVLDGEDADFICKDTYLSSDSAMLSPQADLSIGFGCSCWVCN